MTNIRTQMSTQPSRTRLTGELADARASKQALLEPFEAKAHGAKELITRRAAQNSERTARTWKWVAILGTVAAFGSFVAPKVAELIAPTIAGHTYSQDELAGMPQQTYMIKPNQGIDSAISKVDGKADIFSNGPNLSAVEDYVAKQAPGGVVQPDEVVSVPVLPGGGK